MKLQSFAAAMRRLALSALVLGVPTDIFANPETNRALSVRVPAPSEYVLDVHLDPVAHRISAMARIKVADDGISVPVTFLLNHQLDVISVREDNQPVTFSRGAPDQESKPLRVELAPRSGKRSVREIQIEYQGTISPPGAKDPDWMGALVIRTNEIRMTEQTKWYPVMNGQRAPFRASISLPSDFVLACPDECRKATNAVGQTTWEVVCTNPVAPALIAGRYTVAGKPPVGAYLFPECADDAEVLLQQARSILDFFESQFGPRPFEQLSVCQMRILNSQFSYDFAGPGVVVLPTELVRMARRPERQAFWTRKLAHEIAHQWWSCSVELPREPWPLHESLAELSAILYLQSLQPGKPLSDFLAEETAEIRRLSSLARRGEMLAERDQRKSLGYRKGPWVLAMLRDMLGEKVFDQALRSFYSQHRFQRATAEDFRNCFGNCTVMPLQTFFEQWIDRPVLPRLSVQNVESSKPNPVITLRITQAEPVFSLPVELRLTTATASVITNCLLTQARQLIETRIPGPLLDLEVDPRGKLLLELQADSHALDKTLLQAKAAYEGLLAAHRANQMDVLGNQSKELRNILRRFSAAMNIEQVRRQLSSRGPLDAKTKLQIEESEHLKAAMESFFAKAIQPADLGRLLREIAELADEIHDAVRDNKPEQIAAELPKLTKVWGQFSEHVRACSRIGF